MIRNLFIAIMLVFLYGCSKGTISNYDLYGICISKNNIRNFRFEMYEYFQRQINKNSSYKLKDASYQKFREYQEIDESLDLEKDLSVFIYIIDRDNKLIFNANNIGNSQDLIIATSDHNFTEKVLDEFLTNRYITRKKLFKEGASVPLNFCDGS